MDYPQFVSETYPAKSFAVAIDRCVNWYPEIESKESKSVIAYFPTPGLTLVADTSALGQGRAMFALDGRQFAVIGKYLVEFDQYGTWAKHPGDADPNPVFLAVDDNPATITANSKTPPQLFITSGGKGYIYDLSSNALTEITGGTDPNDPAGNTPGVFNGASMGAFLDGYFIALTPDSRGFQISQINDGFTWAGADVQFNNASADKIKAIITDHEYLYLAGSKRMAVYANTGPQATSDFPINPVPGAFIEQGIRAPFSFQRVDNTLMFFGENEHGAGCVYRMEGFIPKRVSTHAIESVWARYGEDTDAIAFTDHREGHTFYHLTFPAADQTWVYDLATGMWHERARWDSARGQYHAQTQRFHSYATGGVSPFGRHFVTGIDGKIYREDDYVFTEDGRPIRRVRIAPVIAKNNKLMFVSRLEIVVEPAIGLDGDPAAQGANPRMMLRYSPNSGKTWSGVMTARAGRIGENDVRVVFDRLGSGRAWVPEISVTDPVKWVIVGAQIEAEAGAW